MECSDPDGNVHDDHELCNEVQKPESVRECETENEEVCEKFWIATQWSVCTSKCTNVTGIQTRNVFCATKDDNSTITILDDESVCNEELK